MTASPEQQRAVVRALRMLQRKSERGDERRIRAMAKAGHVEAKSIVAKWDREDRRAEFPRFLPDGSEVKSLPEVAALMGKSLTVAARYVIETPGLPINLYTEAKRALSVMASDNDGVAIMLKFAEEDAIWVTGMGEAATKPEDLHCTVAFFGNVGDAGVPNEYELLRVARKIARKHEEFEVNVSGITRFNASGPRPVVALLSAPELEDIRQMVTASKVGPFVNREHGYTPHMTLGYESQDGEQVDLDGYRLPERPMRVVSVQLGYGDTYTTYPLSEGGRMAEKALIRRVRTPAGARRYGQVIGSVIIRDLIPNVSMVPNVPQAAPKKPTTPRKPATKPATPRKPRVAKSPFGNADWERSSEWSSLSPKGLSYRLYINDDKRAILSPHGRTLGYLVRERILGRDHAYRATNEYGDELIPKTTSLPDLLDHMEAWYQDPQMAALEETGESGASKHFNWDATVSNNRVTYNATQKGKGSARAEFRYDVDSGAWVSWVTLTDHPSADRQRIQSRDFNELLNTMDNMVTTDETLWGKSVPVSKARNDAAVWDWFWGVRGKDWAEENDPDPEDLQTERARIQLALQDAEEMGIVLGTWLEDKHFSADSAEMINAAHRAMTSMFENYDAIQSLYYLDDRPFGAIAWNGSSQLDGEFAGSIGMGFQTDYFDGTDPDKIVRTKKSGEESGFYAASITAVQEGFDINERQAAMLLTIFHEHGHTVARALFGESWFNIDDVTRSRYDEDEMAAVSLPFRKALGAHLHKYGIITSDMKDLMGSVRLEENYNTARRGEFPLPVNTDRLQAHLSTYGTTNLHELMAETWVSYMTDKRPTKFVYELGNIMNDGFQDFLAYHFPEGD